MSNNQAKKARAAKHNAAYIAKQEQPAKQLRRTRKELLVFVGLVIIFIGIIL